MLPTDSLFMLVSGSFTLHITPTVIGFACKEVHHCIGITGNRQHDIILKCVYNFFYYYFCSLSLTTYIKTA